MEIVNYRQLLAKVLKFFQDILELKVFKIYKRDIKTMTVVKAALVSQITAIIVSGMYCNINWNYLSLEALIEPLITAISMSRELWCCLLFYVNREKLNELIGRIVTDRELVTAFDCNWILTQKHCKREASVLGVITVFFVFMFFFVVTASILLFPNKYHVPFDFGIPGLPASYPIFTWMINYAHQLYFITFLYLCYMFKFYLTMIIMNHSCWLIDSTLAHVVELNLALVSDDDPPSMTAITDGLQTIADMVKAIVEWQQNACDVLALNFLGIFMLQCTSNCLLFFYFSTNSAGSYVAVYGLIMMLNEIFVYCWMGSRVVSRLEMLEEALYGLGWDRLKPRQRKDLCLALLMSQHVQTYNGIFSPVNFETFQAILEFNHSVTSILCAIGSSD